MKTKQLAKYTQQHNCKECLSWSFPGAHFVQWKTSHSLFDTGMLCLCYASVPPRCRWASQKRKGGSKCWKKMLLHDSSLGLRGTSTSASLQWFPISFRIDFKFLLLTFKALHGLAAKYISDAQYWPGMCPPDNRHLLMEPCWLYPQITRWQSPQTSQPPAKSQTHQFSCVF